MSNRKRISLKPTGTPSVPCSTRSGADHSRQIVVLKGRQLIEIIARSKLKSLPIGGSVWITLADLDLLAHLHRSDRMNFPQREALGLAPIGFLSSPLVT